MDKATIQRHRSLKDRSAKTLKGKMLLAPCLNMVKGDQTYTEETAILFPLKLSNQVPQQV